MMIAGSISPALFLSPAASPLPVTMIVSAEITATCRYDLFVFGKNPL
jgi:hypothetical protein